MKDKKDIAEPLARGKRILRKNVNLQLCGKLATDKTLRLFSL